MKIYSYNGRKNISGERIREARQKLKLSQADLTAQMQVEGIVIERDSISRIEIGTRFIPDYELPVFSKVLKVPVEWILEMGKRVSMPSKNIDTLYFYFDGYPIKLCVKGKLPWVRIAG